MHPLPVANKYVSRLTLRGCNRGNACYVMFMATVSMAKFIITAIERMDYGE